MKRIVRLTESDLTRIVKRVIMEQKTPIDLGFEKWGDGFLLRIPKGSTPNKNVIRVQADPIGDNYNIMVLVQGNKRTRSEIKGINVFKEIEGIIGSKFRRQDNIFDIVGGQGSIGDLKNIVTKLKTLKVDEENNWFTV
tara:strand:- start:14218 stop:14631 length:414 start_codon:yes stop_codon:yes gene_type:complete